MSMEKRELELMRSWQEWIPSVMGNPDFAFTITMKPTARRMSKESKITDATSAFDRFLYFLNCRCFNHQFKKHGRQLGIVAALEGLRDYGEPHWHGAIRLPDGLDREVFTRAFKVTIKKTRRFGSEWRLEPYYSDYWINYFTKTGADSIAPEFLRHGSN